MPAKYPCTVCKKSCKDSQQCLQCDNCNRWQHRTCNTGISEDYYHQLSQMDDFPWNCSNCSPNTSDSTLPSQGPDAESTRLQASTAANSNYNRNSKGCSAKVGFRDTVYIREGSDHTHAPDMAFAARAKLGRIIRKAVRKDIFRHAGPIVDEALNHVPPGVQLPSVDNLKRAVHRARAGLRPSHPTAKDFELDMRHIPVDFLQRDIMHEGERFLIFATKKQLELLINAKHIAGAFQQLKDRCPADERLVGLTHYIEKSWITHKRRKPESWSTFRRFLRTNNDCEGWHNHLNSELPHDHPNMYILIPFLHQEAEKVERTVQLVCQQVVQRQRTQEAKSKQAALEKLWDKYASGQYSTFGYLKKCSKKRDHAEEAS
ncbi:hypothetical protein Pmani_018711 [Petrolisthes manimaculis]|uniref:PHD-type domain-containing protein n=1 Tax=Petrolisthes manimaculis TaxID=1843537 RepID=A0AAE1U844_9EUCA|nr:hypothetical protein Pmani_018711 [Petrolisthes manimaculis]